MTNKYSSIVADRIVRQVYEKAPSGVGGHMLTVVVYTILSYSLVDQTTLLMWALLQTIILAGRAYLVVQFRRAEKTLPKPDTWLNYYIIGAGITGALWGIVIYLPAATTLHIFFTACVLYALAGAGMFTLGNSFAQYMFFVIPLLSPLVLWLFFQTDVISLGLGLFTLIYLGYLIKAVKSYSQNFVDAIYHERKTQETQLDILNRLGMAIEFRDGETGAHVKRIGHYSRILAEAVALPPEQCDIIMQASPMHDAGKIGIPDNILLKQGQLDDDEWSVMKTHATIGENLLKNEESELMMTASRIAGSHHENWDGNGYPRGLSGQEIPLEGRITAICDVYDALTSKRPYKTVWTNDDAFKYLKENAGIKFDPELVDLFIKNRDQILHIRDLNPDT